MIILGLYSKVLAFVLFTTMKSHGQCKSKENSQTDDACRISL